MHASLGYHTSANRTALPTFKQDSHPYITTSANRTAIPTLLHQQTGQPSLLHQQTGQPSLHYYISKQDTLLHISKQDSPPYIITYQQTGQPPPPPPLYSYISKQTALPTLLHQHYRTTLPTLLHQQTGRPSLHCYISAKQNSPPYITTSALQDSTHYTIVHQF